MKTMLTLAALLALAGCSRKAPPEPQAPADTQARVATPFDAMKAQEQRARDARKAVEAAQRKQAEAIDQAAGQ